MKRIRYVRSNDGWVSMQTISTPVGDLKACISADGKRGALITSKGDVVYSIEKTSAHKTKIALKDELAKMGVAFNREKRKPRVEKVVE